MRKVRITFGCLLFLLIAGPTAARQSPFDAQIARMSLEQRVAQMFMVTLHGSVMTEVGAEFLREWQPGGIVLFGANVGTPAAVTQLTNDFQQTILEVGDIPLLISIDFEGGVVERLMDEGFTRYPVPAVITAAGEEMAYRIGQAMGQELRAVGINMNLAPVADLETNLDNPIIDRRAFGSDPEVTGRVIAAYTRGLQSQNVLATAKHFPGHGDTGEDSHAVLQSLNLSRARLDSVELVPFAHAIDAGVGVIMAAHIHFPALESPPRFIPASLSPNVITGLLRDEMGYAGLVMTDALDMNAVDLEFPFAQAAVMAVEAGVDLLATGPSINPEIAATAIQAVIDAVRAGTISEARINESVRRILEAKARFGAMFWQPLDPATAADRVNAAQHTELITALFEAAVTVAFDRNNLIPITPDRSVAIVFLGTRYQIYNECNLYDHPNIRWAAVSDSPSYDEIGRAVEAANASQTTVVFTQNAISNPAQANLVNALPQDRTIAVALLSAYDWRAYPNVAAYLATYSSWRPAVPPVCAVLFGQRPATGQLPVTLSADLLAGTRVERLAQVAAIAP
ncbi:MAG: hypothetical protein GYB67_16815 [Chloroflexi bacterium]|nr:hypothetical protein [Chloroflexota bacterium]